MIWCPVTVTLDFNYVGSPFYEGVDLTDVMGDLASVTIEAINYNGQRVKVNAVINLKNIIEAKSVLSLVCMRTYCVYILWM